MSELAPIALFCYRRLPTLRLTIDALRRNARASESRLIVFSDGARGGKDAADVAAVRAYLREIDGFRDVRVVERPTNFGLQSNIVSGVTDVVNEFGRVIVLEDDLVTAPGFLTFMNDALERWATESRVISVLGYSYFSVPESGSNVYLISRQADCLGWGTWKRGWALFEPDGAKLLERIQGSGLEHAFDREGSYPYTRMLRHQSKGIENSWAVRWYASAFVNDKYSVYPQRSFVLHVGNTSDGTHYDVGADDPLHVPLFDGFLPVADAELDFMHTGDERYRAFTRRVGRRSLGRLLRKAASLAWHRPIDGIRRVVTAFARAVR